MTQANVLITAQNEETRAVLASVIGKSLQDAGFTNVDAKIEEGDAQLTGADGVPSMLDVVRANNPSLFDTAVTISQAVPAFVAAEDEVQS